MATTATNNIVRSDSPIVVIEDAGGFLSSSVSFNQGDLLCLDTTNHVLKALAVDGDNATFLGAARQTIVNGKLASPYSTAVDAAQAVTSIAGPIAGVTALLKLNTGDAFNPGDKVYGIGSVDAQTVSSSSNTGARKAIGIFVDSAVASASGGQTAQIKLIPQYPIAW